MRKFLMIAVALTALSACTSTQQGAVLGAAGGAIAGQVIGGDTKATLIGAATGAAAGGVIGNVTGRNTNGNVTAPTLNGGKQCIYQNPDGSQYQAACPAGY